MKNRKSYKYPLLNDKQWLYQKYIVEELSTKQITKIVGAKTPNSVRQALIRHNIVVRNVSEGLILNREDDGFTFNKDVVYGSLLGDASLRCWNPESKISYPYFKKKNKFLSHIKLVGNLIFNKPYEDRISEEWKEDKKYYTLRSLSHKSLRHHFDKWYPKENNFTKVVPKDIVLTPEMILHWFLDDGFTYLRRKQSKTKQVVVGLCTECFVEKDQLILLNQLKDTFNLSCRLKKVSKGTGYRIMINQGSYEDFINILGPCPIDDMSYKWK